KGGGNPLVFLRKLYDICSPDETPLKHLSDERGFLDWQSIASWGVAVSPLNGEYVIPGFNPDGILSQLYRYTSFVPGQKKRALATSGLDHQLFGMPLFDRKKGTVYLVEGPWDGIAFWEVLRSCRKDAASGEYVMTANPSASLAADANV